MQSKFYEPQGTGQFLTQIEKKLIAELKNASTDTRLSVAINLARSGHISIIGAAGIPGLFEQVSEALRKEDGNLSADKNCCEFI